MSEKEQKTDRSEYFKAYYENKKEELSAKKKKRYDDDPDFRERAKERARKYRRERAEERERLRAEGVLPKPNLKRGPRKPVTVMIGGDTYDAYSITTVAKEIRRSVNTMNYWTKMKLLPETPLRRGRERLYTTAMILTMRLALAKRGKVMLGDTAFYKEIRQGWVEIGVYSAAVEIVKR